MCSNGLLLVANENRNSGFSNIVKNAFSEYVYMLQIFPFLLIEINKIFGKLKAIKGRQAQYINTSAQNVLHYKQFGGIFI
jgi:hypothetical protein